MESRSQTKSGPDVGYDDRKIAQIRLGQTAEAQLLDWFGPPESRELKPDGRAKLSWGFSPRADDGRGRAGALTVNLAPDGRAESYSARARALEKTRTVEFVEHSDADLRQHMAEWKREGWSVLSISARLPQADGTVLRKAQLSRSDSGGASSAAYDDRQIARIARGQTTESQLLDWFGLPESRAVGANGCAQLCWSFARRADGGPGHSGDLTASLGPSGTVDAYSARRGPE